MLLPIVKFVQYTLGHVSQWESFNEIIPYGCCVIAKSDSSDDIVFKIGDGAHKYIDLPIVFYFKYTNGVFIASKLDIDPSKVDYLLYIDNENNITVSPFKIDDFKELFNGQAAANFHFTDVKPIINGPDKISLGSIVTFHITSYSIFSACGDIITAVDWILPDNSTVTIENSNELTYHCNLNSNMINQTVFIKARVKDKYNYYSRYVDKAILIVSSGNNGYVQNTILS